MTIVDKPLIQLHVNSFKCSVS